MAPPNSARARIFYPSSENKGTNIRTGKKAPAVYLSEIEAELGAERLDMVLESHLLPGGADSSLREGRFADFLDDCQQRFA